MHGGDIYRNQVTLDFSVNVNPLGMPERVKLALLQGVSDAGNYPDPVCEDLRREIALHFGLAPENVLCGNGASELILALCRWKRPKKALLLAPGFSGYQKALHVTACTIWHFMLQEEESFGLTRDRFTRLCDEIREKKPDLFFLANPSNPAGCLLEKEWLLELAQCCGQTGTVLVLDECFLELTPKPEDFSMSDMLRKYPHLLILRAFTKSFAIPGIRLGYLLCGDKRTAEAIAGQLPEWNVSVPAQLAGRAALKEKEYLQKSREVIAGERAFLEAELKKLGARVYSSRANFILFWRGGENLYERFLERGILIRDCRDYEGLSAGYYRIAVRTHEENIRLLEVMRAILAEGDNGKDTV